MSVAPGDARKDLIGLTREELAAEMAAVGAAPFRARQLWHWIYHRGATDFAAMTTLAKNFRAELDAHYRIGRPEVARGQVSSDGTRKWLLRFGDGQEAECVHIPEDDRGTLCVSSQVGCTLNCRFCHTGTQWLVRNLDAGRDRRPGACWRATQLGEWPSPQEDRLLTNIVLMGMGEPLYNYDNVAKAINIVMDDEGLSRVEAQDHAVDRGRGAGDPALRRGARRQSCDLAARHQRRAARRAGAAQQEISDRGTADRPAAPIPARTMRGASRSNM